MINIRHSSTKNVNTPHLQMFLGVAHKSFSVGHSEILGGPNDVPSCDSSGTREPP